ncbi:MAG: cytochrome c [SAR202 cluster bacterium]|nr:cytochrome c [SAR202 cluster bacterium]
MKRGKIQLWGVGAAGLLVAGVLIWWFVAEIPDTRLGNPATESVQSLESTQIEIGRTTYQANCAQCHGANAEGQPFWQQRNTDGTLKPPPHDETGHTWHHSDGLLFRIVRDGGTIYETPGFKSSMPAFGDRLSSEEIKAVITYFKSLWGPEIRSSQAEVSQRDPFP